MMRKFMMNTKEDNKKRRWIPNDEQWLLFLRLLSMIAFNLYLYVCASPLYILWIRAFNFETFHLHWITIYTNLECILFKIIKKMRCQLNNNFLIHQHFVAVFRLHEIILVLWFEKFAMKRKRTLLASVDYHQPEWHGKKKGYFVCLNFNIEW